MLLLSILLLVGILPASQINVSLEREALWVAADDSGCECVRLSVTSDSITADGVIVHLDPSAPYSLHYRILCDPGWHVRELAVRREGANTVLLRCDHDRHWTDAKGDRLQTLDGCGDVDILASPFTNTIALRRLGLAQGETALISVAFLSVPEMTMKAVQQRYTFLQKGTQQSMYRYESLSSGIMTELPVDPDGLVIEYPNSFRRLWSR